MNSTTFPVSPTAKPAKPVAALRIERRRSLLLAGILAIVHGGALVLIVQLDVALALRVLLGAAVIASMYVTLNSQALLHADGAVVKLVRRGDGLWTLHTAAGAEHEVRLLPGSYVTAYFVILNFATPSRWRRRSVILMPDALDAAQFRRLRVRLRFTKSS
jgi:toxin CptA